MQALSALKHSDAAVRTELQDIRAAVKGLLLLKTERLKWPGIDSDERQSDSTS
jgi:hypothetical protein